MSVVTRCGQFSWLSRLSIQSSTSEDPRDERTRWNLFNKMNKYGGDRKDINSFYSHRYSILPTLLIDSKKIRLKELDTDYVSVITYSKSMTPMIDED